MESLLVYTLEHAALFFPLLVGMWLSVQVLGLADLTADAASVMGAGVFAMWVTRGGSPWWGLLCAVATGAAVGGIYAAMQWRQRLHPLLAGLFLVFALYAVALLVMGKPNLDLLGRDTCISRLVGTGPRSSWRVVGALCGLHVVWILLLIGLFRSKLGLLWRAYGDNPALLRRMGRSADGVRIAGLCVSGALAGLSGCLTAQIDGYAVIDTNKGQALIGLGVLLFGVRLFRDKRAAQVSAWDLLRLWVACILYMLSYTVLSRLGINTLYHHLCIALALCGFFWLHPSARFLGRRGL